MRHTSAAVVVAASLVLAGCGPGTRDAATDTEPPNRRETPGIAPTPSSVDTSLPGVAGQTVDGYRALAEETTTFFAKALRVGALDPGGPGDAAAAKVTVGHAFTSTVDLVAWDRDPVRACFTGPADTYLTISALEPYTLRTLGRGKCDYTEDAPVVLAVTPSHNPDGPAFVQEIGRGRRIVTKVPELDDFVEVFNEAVTDIG